MPGRVRGLKGVEIYAIFRIPRLFGWERRLKKKKKPSAVGILLSSSASHLQDSGSNKSPLREWRGGLG